MESSHPRFRFDPQSLVALKRRSTHQVVGTGLGLALSHGIIERHGGRIRVESEPAHGVTCVIELSLYATPDDSSVRRE